MHGVAGRDPGRVQKPLESAKFPTSTLKAILEIEIKNSACFAPLEGRRNVVFLHIYLSTYPLEVVE